MKKIIASTFLIASALGAVGCSADAAGDEITSSTENAFSSTRRVHCSSEQHRDNSCDVDGEIQSVRLVRQYSHASCNEGRSWGYRDRYVWVDDGCEGDFDVELRGWGGWDSERLSCSSDGYRFQRCFS